MNLLVASTGALPAIAAMAYADWVDRKRPEPRSTLRKITLAGALSLLPCAAFEWALDKLFTGDGYQGAVIRSFVVIALVEEMAKMLCLRFVVWGRPEFDERLDGPLYATRAAMGFALLENVNYLLAAQGTLAFVVTYVVRALLTVPMHAITAGLMGYFAARRRFDGVGPGPLGGYALAVVLHGSFDAALFCSGEATSRGNEALAVALLAVPCAIVIGGAYALTTLGDRLLHDDDQGVLTRRRQRMTFFG